MAKELVEKNGIGKSADAIWKQFKREHERLFPVRTLEADAKPGLDIPSVHGAGTPESSTTIIDSALDHKDIRLLGDRLEELRTTRRRVRATPAEQGVLFTWK